MKEKNDNRYIITCNEQGLFYAKNTIYNIQTITADVIQLYDDFNIKELEIIDKLIDLVNIKFVSYSFRIETAKIITL